MENKKLFMDGMGIKSMLWMGAMGIAFVNADAVDNLTGKAVWQQENISCEEDARYVGYDYCSKYGYTYYTGNCDQKSSGFVNEGVGYKSYKMCAYLQAVKLANYALKGETGEDEVKILKEKCVPKTTEKNGYDYQDYNCESNWYGYMKKDTFDDTCEPQLGINYAGQDSYGWYSYDLCSFQPGTYAKKYYGIGAVAQSEKMVEQARDAKQQVTNDEAKNAAKAKEDRESRKEAKEGKLKVQECSDAIKKGETKDKFFCFNGAGGQRFFKKDLKEWGKSLEAKVNIKINGELKEVNVEVWPKCEGVNTPCGKTTDKNTEYFTKDGNYLLRQEEGEKQTADDSEGDDGEDDKTVTYEDLEELKYDLVVKDIIAKCTTKPGEPYCQLVLHKDFEGALQDIRKEVANEAAKKIAEEANEAAKKREETEIERLQRKADYYKEKIEEHQAEKQLEALEEDEQELIIKESEQKLIERQRLINLEKYGAGMNKEAPVVETGSK